MDADCSLAASLLALASVLEEAGFSSLEEAGFSSLEEAVCSCLEEAVVSSLEEVLLCEEETGFSSLEEAGLSSLEEASEPLELVDELDGAPLTVNSSLLLVTVQSL